MEKTILEKNLEQISRYNEKLAKRIAELNQLEHSFELLEAKSGDINLLYNGILLHDNIDPQEEAYNIFRSLPDNSKSSINVLFGLGLGYIFKRFALSCKGKIIILEPNLDILRITLELVDISEDLSKDSIIIVDSIGDLEKYFEKLYFAGAEVNLKFLDSYALLNPEILAKLRQKIEFIKGLYESNYNNLFRNCMDWTIAGIANIPEVLTYNEVESLRNKFINKPAVIISAGPSLDRNIEFLKEYQDRVVIFCVGTALKTAVKHGIKPDFLTVVEHNNCVSQLSGIDTSDMNMILMPFTHEYFHEVPTKRKFNFYPKNDFTAIWLAKLLEVPLDDYYNKGTVSLCALFSANILGCNPIILIGQDLAYTDGRCYSNDSAYRDLKCIKNELNGKFEIKVDNFEAYVQMVKPNFQPESDAPEEIARIKILNHETGTQIAKSKIASLLEGLYFVKGQNEEMLPTEAGYAIFISYFEQVARDLGNKIQFINSTESGAYLEGFEHISLKSALDRHAQNSFDAESIIHESVKSGRNLLKAKGETVLNEIDNTINLIENNLHYFEQGKIYTVKLNKELNNHRLNTEYFKEHCQQVLSCYIAIEEKILAKNGLIIGLIFPQYSKLSNYLSTYNDIIDYQSIISFVELATDFFVNGYENIQEKMNILRTTRKRLNDNCNSAS
ncbi:MAG: DUF115 domain-containing protein [Candidatus Gastranaerophilales bacterium]|nr:DUF115 domain-containing protein [Candidatus Gastranaerophilales bacterium]